MSNWKDLSVYTIVLLTIWTIASCTSDNSGAVSEPDCPISVRLTIETKANENDTPENQINTLRVYAFQNGKLVGTRYTDQITSLPHSFDMELLKGETTFYAIANEKEAGLLLTNNQEPEISLENISTQQQLESLTFSKLPEAKYLSGGTEDSKDEFEKNYQTAVLPMTAKQSVQVKATTPINLSLKRSVAKLQLYFAKANVADAGEGQLYMGRGLYLYNMPEYGYLFPKEKYEYTGDFNCLEGAGESSDSKNQKNGKVILSAGWPEEPETAPQEGTQEYKEYEKNLKEKTHINEIKALAHAGNTDTEKFQWMPAKPIYLFANPNEIADRYPENPSAERSRGYYLKILSHEHKMGSDGMEGHEADMQYVALPEVRANQSLRLFSVISMHAHAGVTAHWIIVPWETGGGDIEFE